MSEKTHIEWASHTASPWFGCSKVSPGCTNCYAEKLTLQKGWAGWGENAVRVRSKGFWKDAYRLDRKAEDAVTMGFDRPRMFTSLMDWLDPLAPIEWLADFLRVIHDCSNLNWLLLTKRPELWRDRVNSAYCHLLATGNATRPESNLRNWLENWFTHSMAPENVWFGVTVENQAMAETRMPILAGIPAKIRWLSVEPLLEKVDLGLLGTVVKTIRPNYTLYHSVIDWVVVGGESGPKRRDCGISAIVSIVKQCSDMMVPVFVKQDCALKPGQQGRITDGIWKFKEYPKCP